MKNYLMFRILAPLFNVILIALDLLGNVIKVALFLLILIISIFSPSHNVANKAYEWWDALFDVQKTTYYRTKYSYDALRDSYKDVEGVE